MPNKKDVKVWSSAFQWSFKGFIKNGIDSSTLVNLTLIHNKDKDAFKKRGFESPPNLFYNHLISRREVIGVLINKKNFSKKKAVEEFDQLVKDFNLIPIKEESGDIKYKSIVKDANKRIIEKIKNPELKKKLEIGEEDITIIAGFLRENINLVHTGDKGFQLTCEELNMNVIPIPKRDFKKEKEMKRYMK